MDNLIGERLKKRRKDLHLTQVQVKELCGVSNGNLSDFENGNKIPSAGALLLLSDALQVSIDWILRGKEYHECDTSSVIKLNEQEQEMISIFRKLSNDDRDEVVAFTEYRLSRNAKRGTRSSLSDGSDPDGLSVSSGSVSA